MSNVVVLSGGVSDERDVSLRSGAAVKVALVKLGHNVIEIDPTEKLETYLSTLKSADVVFIAMHGVGGEDGITQKFLEDNNIRFIGCDSKSSALCFDKFEYTNLLAENNILVPKTELVNYEQFQKSDLSKKPFVLKPNDGGSSIDTFIVRDPESNTDKYDFKTSFIRHKKMLLQELITGNEITVAVLGERGLPVIEIIPPADQEFDYDNKYNGATQELCPPVNISPSIQEDAKHLVEQIHSLCGCRDMSRTDMIISDNKLYVLETNTIPGLTDQSLFPRAANAAGFDMTSLCGSLVDSAINR